jgi:hypothetical protein
MSYVCRSFNCIKFLFLLGIGWNHCPHMSFFFAPSFESRNVKPIPSHGVFNHRPSIFDGHKSEYLDGPWSLLTS